MKPAGLLDAPLAIVDLETTGAHPAWDRVTEIAVIEVNCGVQDGEVVIVDEFTGRLMSGRRWSDGLHQAVEAKEGVAIQNENQTLASITFQNYFRMYGKLSGMTGTADTEAYEFHQIYSLETVVVPTHRPMVRDDRMDQIYRTAAEKYTAIIADIKDCQQRILEIVQSDQGEDRVIQMNLQVFPLSRPKEKHA